MQREIITLSGAVNSWLGSNSEQNKPRETIYRYTYRFTHVCPTQQYRETLP